MTYIRSDPNDLTKRLFAEGYTPGNLPEYAHWCSGEAEYTSSYISSLTYETPCGLMVKGSETSRNGYLAVGGVEFRHENGNPEHLCPYIPSHRDCVLRSPVLRANMKGYPAACDLHVTDKPWDEAKSAERIRREQEDTDDKRRKDAMSALAKEVRGQGMGFCPEHARWFREEQRAIYLYEYYPSVCNFCPYAPSPCLRCGMDDGGKEGNVLADVREHIAIPACGLIPPDVRVSVTKGIRLFDKPRRLAVCHMAASDAEWVRRKIHGKHEYHQQLFFAEYHGTGYSLDIENVRVVEKGKKDVRDLIADIEAVRNGQTVVHESDKLAAAKAKKKEGAEKRKRAMLRNMEKQVLSGEWLKDSPYRQTKIIKLIGMDRIEELQSLKPTEEPQQLSLLD